MSDESYGRILYLQEKYEEALKYLREKDPFEIMLIESIRITPKDKSTNDYIRSPQLTLIERALLTGNFIKIAEFLKESSNDFVKKLVNILLKNTNLNLLSDLNERERAIAWYYLLVSDLPREYKKVRRFIEEHIGFCKMVGDLYHEACMLDLLGTVYLSTGHFDKAYEIYEKSLEIFKEFDDHHRIASIKHHIALIYYFRQDPENCLKLSRQALEIHERMKYRSGIAMVKALMGLAYFTKREYNIALKLLDEAIQFFRRQYPTRFAILAIYKALIYRYMGLYDEALKLLEEAEKIFKKFKWLHHEEAITTHKSIIYLERGDVNKARIYLSNALKMAKDIGDYHDIVTILLNLVIVTGGKEEYVNEVLKYYKAWRTSLFSLDTAKDVLSSHNFRVVIDALLSSNNVVKAYEAHLELKNKSAIDIFGARVISENLIGVERVRKIEEAEKMIKSVERLSDLRTIRKACETISETISESKIVVDTYLEAEGDEEVVDFHFGEKTGYFHRKRFKEIQFKDLRPFVEDLLNDEIVKSALLYLYDEKGGIEGKQIKIDGNWMYIVYGNGRYWWAELNKQDDLLRLLNDILLACLTHQSHLAYRGIGIKKIDGRWKEFVLTRSEKNARIEQSKYYQEIAERILRYFGEVFEDLFSYDEVIIAPAYPLMNFPYHLIMDSDGKMLIEAAKVKYVPHAGVAKRLKEKEGIKKVEKASIVYSKKVRYADKEAEKIARIIPDSEVIDATNISKEDLLKRIREDARILHFACHAIAMPKAQYSYLEFPNFRLYLPDLLSLKLENLSMVCLSACETGRYEEAIDTLGLPLAFFAKGAKNVIATQWVVYSGAAKKFFTRFYDLIVNDSDVYEAYRNAILEMKNKEKVMFYWGPFAYYGI